ncbi:uncharacterized protein [Oscarella lobularis]
MTLKLTCPPWSKKVVKWEKLDQSSSQWVKAVDLNYRTFVDYHNVKLKLNLTIENLQFADSGLYRCLYLKEGGDHKFNVSVRPLSVKAEVPHVTVYENETISLKCLVFGGIKGVDWYHYVKQLRRGSLGGRVNLGDGGTYYSLEIRRANKSDDGTYKCRGLVNRNRDSNATITVTVKERPMIYHGGDVKTYEQVVGQNLSVLCQRSMTEFFNWTWSRNGVKVFHTKTDMEGQTLRLVFNDLQKADQGQYTCVLEGVKYSDKLTVSVIVLDPPIAPQNVSLHFDCAWGFNVTWLSSVVSSGSDVLKADEYDYEILTENARSPALPSYSKTSTTYTFFTFSRKNICNVTVYYVRVRARNTKFQSSSPFVRVGFVSGSYCKAGGISCTALFPTTLPSIQIRLIKKCCKCRDKGEITPRYLDATLRKHFQSSTVVLQNLLPPTNNSSLRVTRGKRKIFLLEYEGYLNADVSTVQLKDILLLLGQSFSRSNVTLASCSYAFDCIVTFWKGISFPCQLQKSSIAGLKCSTLHSKFFSSNCN